MLCHFEELFYLKHYDPNALVKILDVQHKLRIIQKENYHKFPNKNILILPMILHLLDNQIWYILYMCVVVII